MADPDTVVYDLIVNETQPTRTYPLLQRGRAYDPNERAGTEPYANFTTDVFKAELLRVISVAQSPFFAFVSFAAVHGPLDSRADQRAWAQQAAPCYHSVPHLS